tara:strand:- start:22692 stop:23528 length:837 start_codon:yes stop_codon:yes gene_type:complete
VEIKKYLLLMLLCFVLFMGLSKQNNWIDTLPKPWTLTEKQVSAILPKFYDNFPDFHDRLKAFALWQIGKPYVIFKLGEEVEPDPDPIIRLDVSDCTVHVLTSLAFSQSKSWVEAREKMIDIHYKDGKPSYKTRWHYTSDRIQENPYTVNITKELTEKLEHVDITLNRKADGSEFLDLNWEKKTTVSYIPSEWITEGLLKSLPEVCGVAFIKKGWMKMGLIVAHEGMLIDQKNIVHASSEYGETVNVDFMEYYFRESKPIFDGMMIYEFHPVNNSLIEK